MPTQYYHRLWCRTCSNWTLHDWWLKDDGYKCKDCETVHKPILLKEIPTEKILEQRKRYKEKEKESMGSMGMYLLGPTPSNPFSEDWSKPEIIESDAGQKNIDKIKAEEQEKKAEKRRLERQKQHKEALKYKNLGRNDICLCGSGKKYKKCCLDKIKAIL